MKRIRQLKAYDSIENPSLQKMDGVTVTYVNLKETDEITLKGIILEYKNIRNFVMQVVNKNEPQKYGEIYDIVGSSIYLHHGKQVGKEVQVSYRTDIDDKRD